MDVKQKEKRFSRALRTLIYIGLPALSGFFLWLEHITHVEFLLHLAAIPLEILVGVFLVERLLSSAQKKQDLRRHMYIKSYTFRSELRNVFIANINALKTPAITISDIRTASIEKLKSIRNDVNETAALEYNSDQEIEHIIVEYVYAQKVFYKFMEWAVNHDFEGIFYSMIFLLHFIQDVTQFKKNNPKKLFITEARKTPDEMARINKVLKDGVIALLDYAIQLKQENPKLLDEVLREYEQTSLFSELPTMAFIDRRRVN